MVENPSRPKILVLDDEPFLTILLSEILTTKLGADVEAFEDPLVAAEVLTREHFDFISTDQQMPGLTGLELLAKLRSQPGPNQQTPAILFTGIGNDLRSATDSLTSVWVLDKRGPMDFYLSRAGQVLRDLGFPVDADDGVGHVG